MRNLGLSRLVFNTGSTLIRQFAAVLLGLALMTLLARGLGPRGNGIYAMVILYSGLLATFLNLGIAPANVYFIGRGTVTVRTARHSSLRLWAVLSTAGVSLAAIALIGWGEYLFPGIPEAALWVGVCLFPVQLLQLLLVSLLQGKQDFRHFNLAVVMPAVVTLLAAIIGVWILQGGVIAALLAFALGQLSGLLLAGGAVRTHLEGKEPSESDHDYIRKAIGYGWKVHLSNILAFVNYRVDIYLVNFFLNPAATGIYVIAVQFAERLWMLSQSVSIVLLPRLSELHDDEANRRALTPLASRWTMVLSLIAAFVLGLIALPLITWLFGEQYILAASALLWLLPGIVMGSFSRVLSNDIAARGCPEMNMYVSLLSVLVNVAANLILMPAMGMNGAALATTLSYTVNAIAKLWVYARLSHNAWYKAILMESTDWDLIRQGVRMLLGKLLPVRKAGP